jgi:hypothetical protein
MRLAVGTVVAFAAVLGFRPVCASEAARDFQIAAQPLSQALLEFSRQADIIVTAPAELVRDQRAPEVRGALRPSVALARLLRGYRRGPSLQATAISSPRS